MKKIGIGRSGWRPFLGRSLVAATALLGFTSVHAVTIDTFADGFAKVDLKTLGKTTCVHTLDSANGNNDMVGLDRDVCITYEDEVPEVASGGVHASINNNHLLTIAADVGISGAARVVWDSNGGDNGHLDVSGINPAANLVKNGETTLKLNVWADQVDNKIAVTFYSSADKWTKYVFHVKEANKVLKFSRNLNRSDETGTGPADLTRVTAIELFVLEYKLSMDIGFKLLATPVEVSDFNVTPSGDGMEFSWDTGVESDIAGFMTGRCDSVEGFVGCEGYKWVPAQGNGSSYSSSVDTTGTGDCGMVVIDTEGEPETDSDGAPVVYSVPCP
ncbi:MAG: hypothetical protein ABFS56_13405 [Pseudomonadota bacterium]